MKKLLYLVFLITILPVGFKGQNSGDEAFNGTWKLNVAKSKFSPGPAPKSATVTIGPEGKVVYQAESAEGQTISWSTEMKYDGTAAPITGMENSTVTGKRIDDRTVEHVWKMPDSTSTGRAVLSKDGKSMIYTMTGTTADGKPIHDRELWEKQ